MWLFFPRLPTKEAWENRLFHDQNDLKTMLKTLKASKLTIKGQLYLKGDLDTYYMFGNLADLEVLLKAHEYETKVSEVYIWGIGYFRNNNLFQKKVK